MRTFKIYSLCKFKIYNSVLLTIVTMLYSTTPGLIYFINKFYIYTYFINKFYIYTYFINKFYICKFLSFDHLHP